MSSDGSHVKRDDIVDIFIKAFSLIFFLGAIWATPTRQRCDLNSGYVTLTWLQSVGDTRHVVRVTMQLSGVDG